MSFEEILERDGRLIYTNVGDSMRPLIREGRDLLVITRPSLHPDGRTGGRLKRYDVPLYRRDSGQYVLHRILDVRPDGYVLCGDNRWHKEYGVTDRQIIGVLAAVVRDGHEIPVTDWRYRLYVHLWCDFFPLRAFVLKTRHVRKRRAGR